MSTNGGLDFERLLAALHAPTSTRRVVLLQDFYADMVDVVRGAEEDAARDYAILAMCVQGALATERGISELAVVARDLAEHVEQLTSQMATHSEWAGDMADKQLGSMAEVLERIARLEEVCPGLRGD